MSYYKDNLNRVQIKGWVKNGAIGNAIFKLPKGYRPMETLIFVVNSTDNTYATIEIRSDGVVLCRSAGGVTWIMLDNISFIAEQ